MESTATIAVPHAGLVDRSRIALACGVAILMMFGVGWSVAQPSDSLLGLTFVHSGRAVLPIWLMMLVLGAITAAIATVVAGRHLPEAGLFATGIGMTTMALRGGSMQMILAYCTTPDAVGRRALMWSMGRDCILWAAVMVLAWAASVMVRKWLWPESGPAPAAKKQTTPQLGAGALASTLVVALIVIWLTIARTSVADIARGQVIASVAAGLFLGTMAGRTVTGVNGIHWYLGAALLVGLIAYLVGYLEADMSWATSGIYQRFAVMSSTPPHDLVRPLPVEYVAVGVPAAVAGYWCSDKVEHSAEEGSR
jgi:hypothetical protein